MSYQSLALRRENAAAVLASRNPARPVTFTSTWWVTPHKLCVVKRLLQSRGVHGPARNLKVYLHIHVRRPCMMEYTSSAEQLRDQTTKHDKLRSSAVLLEDAHKCPLC